MSDQHQLRNHSEVHHISDINHVDILSENIGALFIKDDYSDVTLVIENHKFPAHKVILASRSDYFRALLFGGMRESQPDCAEIELKDATAIAFHYLLKYIYTGRINLKDMKEEVVLDILGLTHQFGFSELESRVSVYLQGILSISNVCIVFDIASMYNLCALAETCCEFMDMCAEDVLQHESFLSLSALSVRDICSRDSFFAQEINIFNAIEKWTERNGGVDYREVVKVIRLPLVTLNDLLNIVRPSSLISPDTILDAIKTASECRDSDLNYRGYLITEENVATLRHGAQVICGEMKAALLDGDTINYDLDKGFSRHPIDENQSKGIVVQLAKPSIINSIKLLLWDKDLRSYSYYIDVSMDNKDWIRVVDYSHFLCRSWQRLHFAARVVRFVRIVGTHNTVNRVFHLVAMECFHTKMPINMENGILVPQENVATIAASACVIEGVSRSRNALINGDTKSYDWDSGYTCHQLGSGAIIVQLAQPYIVSSMRLLLWDCDKRSYSYRIEVSTDQHDWHLIADKSREACRSWQTITFSKRPVTFIKIVGTHNTANEVFHCVHFECPGDALAVAEQSRYVRQPTPVASNPAPDASVPSPPHLEITGAASGAVVHQPAENALVMRQAPAVSQSVGSGRQQSARAVNQSGVTTQPVPMVSQSGINMSQVLTMDNLCLNDRERQDLSLPRVPQFAWQPIRPSPQMPQMSPQLSQLPSRQCVGLLNSPQHRGCESRPTIGRPASSCPDVIRRPRANTTTLSTPSSWSRRPNTNGPSGPVRINSQGPTSASPGAMSLGPTRVSPCSPLGATSSGPSRPCPDERESCSGPAGPVNNMDYPCEVMLCESNYSNPTLDNSNCSAASLDNNNCDCSAAESNYSLYSRLYTQDNWQLTAAHSCPDEEFEMGMDDPTFSRDRTRRNDSTSSDCSQSPSLNN